jgi:hypothetical protein
VRELTVAVTLNVGDDMSGTKYDEGKIDWSLLPESTDEMLKVLAFGADKYGRGNWEKGIVYSRLFSACLRHLWAWWRGEELDPETGLSHLDHAAANIAFLSTYVKRGMESLDDRPGVRQ